MVGISYFSSFIGLGALSLCLSACAGGPAKPVSSVKAGLGCVDDSAHCRGQRQAALSALLADTSHSWVRQPASAEAYASGVRLFAFKKRKRVMTCPELTVGRREATAARATLRAASARLTPAQIARGAMLGDEVGKELAREQRRRRCKAA